MSKPLESDKAAEGRRWKRMLAGILVATVIVGGALLTFLVRAAYVALFRHEGTERARFDAAVSRLDDVRSFPPETPFSCAGPPVAGDAVSISLDDRGLLLGSAKTIRSLHPEGEGPWRYVLRGIVRVHAQSVEREPGHTVTLDVEIHRVDLGAAPGATSTVLCAGRVTAHIRTSSTDLRPGDVFDLVEHIACRGVNTPICARPPLNGLVIVP